MLTPGFYELTDSAIQRGHVNLFCPFNRAFWSPTARAHKVAIHTQIVADAVARGILRLLPENPASPAATYSPPRPTLTRATHPRKSPAPAPPHDGGMPMPTSHAPLAERQCGPAPAPPQPNASAGKTSDLPPAARAPSAGERMLLLERVVGDVCKERLCVPVLRVTPKSFIVRLPEQAEPVYLNVNRGWRIAADGKSAGADFNSVQVTPAGAERANERQAHAGAPGGIPPIKNAAAAFSSVSTPNVHIAPTNDL